MDLTKFTNTGPKKIIENRTIINNSDILVETIGDDELEITLKDEQALEKYQNFLFFSTTKAIRAKTNVEAENFFEQSLVDGVEGVMFKSLDSSYKSGLRSGAMAKLKETKEDIDVVIVGAEYGKGKRAGYYSSFFIAVKNDEYIDEEDHYLIVGKVSSGIRELGNEGHSMENITNLLEKFKLHEKDNVVFFEPKIVLQVRYQEIQASSIYASGYALRFPRIISLREDKALEEINSIEDISHFL